MQNVTSIDLLRHGETSLGSCFLGSTDASLSEQGWQQMKQAVKGNAYQRIVSSPLIRCADFAQKFAQDNKIELEIDDDFREIDFGDWEGKTTEELWRTHKKQLIAFWDDPENNTPPNAENLSDFQNRVNFGFMEITKKYKDEKILLVVHGGVIRQIISFILSATFKKTQQINIDYAGLSRVDCYDEYMSLRFINQQIQKS